MGSKPFRVQVNFAKFLRDFNHGIHYSGSARANFYYFGSQALPRQVQKSLELWDMFIVSVRFGTMKYVFRVPGQIVRVAHEISTISAVRRSPDGRKNLQSSGKCL